MNLWKQTCHKVSTDQHDRPSAREERNEHDRAGCEHGAAVARDRDELDKYTALTAGTHLLLDLDAFRGVVHVDGRLERRATELEERLPRLEVATFLHEPTGRLRYKVDLSTDEDGGERGPS